MRNWYKISRSFRATRQVTYFWTDDVSKENISNIVNNWVDRQSGGTNSLVTTKVYKNSNPPDEWLLKELQKIQDNTKLTEIYINSLSKEKQRIFKLEKIKCLNSH